jgi:hypothetical protein
MAQCLSDPPAFTALARGQERRACIAMAFELEVVLHARLFRFREGELQKQ